MSNRASLARSYAILDKVAGVGKVRQREASAHGPGKEAGTHSRGMRHSCMMVSTARVWTTRWAIWPALPGG